MKSLICRTIIVFTFLCPSATYSQIKFEPGYFIDTAGIRTQCLIRNVDWVYNPSFFDYKMDASSSRSRKEVNDVREFGIEHGVKYISASVKIDRSSEMLDDDDISTSYNPEWRDEHIFLKVLIAGDASLFSYEEDNFLRFFYRVKQDSIEQLVYKRYKKAGEASFDYNRNYLNQLFADVNCRNLPLTSFENISYNNHSLVNWVHKNNQCLNSVDSNMIPTKNKKWFAFNILAGANHLSFQSENSPNAQENIQYDPTIAFTAGLELEFILPFNKNKWSAILESSSLSYKSSGYNESGNKLEIDYNTINIMFGVRYYGYINERVKSLFDVGIVKDYKQSRLKPALGIGLGYSRFMVEFRYFSPRGFYDNYLTSGTQRLTNIFLVAKYKLF